MLSEIIDSLVDLSNTFGSLCSLLRLKAKSYKKIIHGKRPMDERCVEQLYAELPKLKSGIKSCHSHPAYALIDRYDVKNNKATASVILLDEQCRYLHSFSMLQPNGLSVAINAPCYWRI